MRVLLSIAMMACSGASAPQPTEPTAGSAAAVPDAAIAMTVDASATTQPTTCAGPAPSPSHKCIQDCGPPVVSATDPPPEWHWLSPDQIKKRDQYGCPRCLPPDARIATPHGERLLRELEVGASIYTVDAAGRRVVAHVVYIGSTVVTGSHSLVRVTLADGRVVSGSPGHPDGAGRLLGALAVGATLDGVVITGVERLPFSADRTWDVLPSGSTGQYVVNGVVLRSTFFRTP